MARATGIRWVAWGMFWGLFWTAGARADGADRLLVHEWGTFTALQDERGEALGGINVDDEPLPDFVHRAHRDLLYSPNQHFDYVAMKGVRQRHPLVTLRLETPVLYFYPPRGARLPLSVDVHVDFRGGWLSEFYPLAKAVAPGLPTKADQPWGTLGEETVGSLDWNGVQVGADRQGPQTDAHVWLAPRQTGAAALTASSGESEKYLFYRGVGHFQAPLRIATAGDRISVRGNFGSVLAPGESVAVGPLWLVHIRPGGQCAFRTIESSAATADGQRVLATADTRFSAADYSPENLSKLIDTMHAALVADGLFADEATAMLETWKQAYFQSPGLRVFSLVPRVWTDYRLPLRISRPCDVERVMVARIELVSPEQRQLLARLRSMEKIDSRWLVDIADTPAARRFFAGRSSFGDLGVKIPGDFQTYLDLGRFRNALVLAEQQRRPSTSLGNFIGMYGLWSLNWQEDPGR